MRISSLIISALLVGGVACGDSSEKNIDNANNANNSNNANNANNSNNVNNVDADTFYYEDVKPILDNRCVACHVENGIGPFALTTFEEANSVSQLIKAEVQGKTMPPWLPGNDCNTFAFDPSLHETQIATISDWVDQGAQMGDPDAEGAALPGIDYVPPVFDTDLVMAEPYTPQIGPDDYRCFVIDWPHTTQKFITGFGVVPGEPSIVHHIIAFLAPPEAVATAEANDAADPGPGYECFGEPQLGNAATAWLGSWAPGGVDTTYPEGTGLPIAAGSKIVVQVHYNTLTNAAIPDLTQVRIKTEDSVQTPGQFILWANPSWFSGNMNIPAGNADVMHNFTFDPTVIYGGSKMTFYRAALHMHLLGSSARTWISKAGGEEECLVDIPSWDFNWQGGVQFQDPVVLETGDRLGLECRWDNSADNQPMVDGQRLTPADRGWGDGSTDEMCLGVYYVTVE